MLMNDNLTEDVWLLLFHTIYYYFSYLIVFSYFLFYFSIFFSCQVVLVLPSQFK